MWIPRKYLIKMIDRQNDLERRVKRMEMMLLENAKSNIASLGNRETDYTLPNELLTIEEIVDKSTRRV